MKNEKTAGPFNPVPLSKIPQGTRGGVKQKWLRDHRDEILSYCRANGEEATRLEYNIKVDSTWQKLLSPVRRQPKTFDKADRAISIALIAQAEAIEAKRKNRDLEEQFAKFVPLVAEQLLEKFFKPLLAGMITLPPELEYKPTTNPTSLVNFKDLVPGPDPGGVNKLRREKID